MSGSRNDLQTARIMIVDKDINIRRMMEMILVSDQFQVVTAHSGEESLSLMESEDTFDIVISSFSLPIMNGVEFLRQVSVKHPDTVRILMTGGCGDVVDLNLAVSEGHINRVAIKPLCFKTIREQLKNDLASARASDH